MSLLSYIYCICQCRQHKYFCCISQLGLECRLSHAADGGKRVNSFTQGSNSCRQVVLGFEYSNVNYLMQSNSSVFHQWWFAVGGDHDQPYSHPQPSLDLITRQIVNSKLLLNMWLLNSTGSSKELKSLHFYFLYTQSGTDKKASDGNGLRNK